jgi:hypothetical protein
MAQLTAGDFIQTLIQDGMVISEKPRFTKVIPHTIFPWPTISQKPAVTNMLRSPIGFPTVTILNYHVLYGFCTYIRGKLVGFQP